MRRGRRASRRRAFRARGGRSTGPGRRSSAQKISTPSSPVYPVRAAVHFTFATIASRKWKLFSCAERGGVAPGAVEHVERFRPLEGDEGGLVAPVVELAVVLGRLREDLHHLVAVRGVADDQEAVGSGAVNDEVVEDCPLRRCSSTCTAPGRPRASRRRSSRGSSRPEARIRRASRARPCGRHRRGRPRCGPPGARQRCPCTARASPIRRTGRCAPRERREIRTESVRRSGASGALESSVMRLGSLIAISRICPTEIASPHALAQARAGAARRATLPPMATPWDRAAAGYLDEWVPRFVPYHLDLVRELALHPGARVLVASAGPGSEVLAVAGPSEAAGRSSDGQERRDGRALPRAGEDARVSRTWRSTSRTRPRQLGDPGTRSCARSGSGRSRIGGTSCAPGPRRSRRAGRSASSPGDPPTAKARSRSSRQAWPRWSLLLTSRARASSRNASRWPSCSTKGGSRWFVTRSSAIPSFSRARSTSSAR